MEIAKEKGLPELKHHILPRTKGFTLLLQGAEDRSKLTCCLFLPKLCLVTGVYDLTIGIKKSRPESTLLSIIKGRPCQAEIFVRRFPVSDIPKDTEGSGEWIHQLYREKDEIFEYFVQHDTYEGNGLPRVEVPRNYQDLLIELGWMLIIGVPSIVYLLKFLWTSSIIAQIIFFILIFLGKYRKFDSSKLKFYSFDFSLATIGVRGMIAVTEIERGSHYGDKQEQK